MKLRSQLMIANGLSIGFIFIFLIFSYIRMFLHLEAILVLTAVTLFAGVISFLTHYILTRPIHRAIRTISLETKEISEGKFEGKVPAMGPIEFRELADHFNEMRGKLAQSFTRLQQAEMSRKELVANVSHDLRTPLASIQSFVEALQDGVIEDDYTFQKYLKTISLETGRISHLIDDLFQLSRLDAGSETFQPEPFHLDNLILETLENQYVQLQNNQIEVSVHIPDKMPPVVIVPYQIKRVLINILQNAIRYSPTGSLITLEAENLSGEQVKVTVSDQGEGMIEEDMAAVFERFYRVEKSRNLNYGGSGLGLSIAKSIVEMHGGSIGVESTLGKGSMFWFTLPKYN
ncbi:two-component system sensor histidine kinase SaeS [Scopulibacillus darangshiensis]|uniref:histidine kinase n=1 Tax=Scopulibacillus darangshiensis TaxID=442528 RepID=A0A4R2P3R3_9BACL|nr:ATP-binding protein [Scopulibacillus darangshiensis]TCP29410.1 two-component system sensor histidine kinase SaeS [Scopulibacillus darangshiensis]